MPMIPSHGSRRTAPSRAAHRELRLGHRRQPLGAGITIFTDPRIARLITLIRTALRPARGAGRIALVQTLGALCHTAFAAGVLAMILAMFFGLSESLGTVPWPWAVLANAALIVQFPLIHFLLFTGPGGWLLARLILGPYEATLAATTYASAQLLALFALWTPSGVGPTGQRSGQCPSAYAASWLILLKASFDARAEVQSDTLGWTPNQLALATCFTAYCLLPHGSRNATLPPATARGLTVIAPQFPMRCPAWRLRRTNLMRNDLTIYDKIEDRWWSDDICWVRTLKNLVSGWLK
jgi:hypothetical protein